MPYPEVPVHHSFRAVPERLKRVPNLTMFMVPSMTVFPPSRRAATLRAGRSFVRGRTIDAMIRRVAPLLASAIEVVAALPPCMFTIRERGLVLSG